MEDGMYTLKELSEGLGWAEWAIKDAIRSAFPNRTFRREDCNYEVVSMTDGMFQVTYVGR